MKFENPARPRQRLIARVLACVLRCGFSFLILLHVAVSQGQVPSADSTSALLTNAQQIAALGTNFTSGTQTARLSVVVLYVSGTRRLYVQDGELGVQVNLSEATTGIHVGHRVEVTGTVLGGNPLLRLGNARATVLSEGVLPEPKLVSAHRLVRGRDPFRYVAVRGFVRDMVSTRNAMTLLLTDGAFPFEVIIQSSPPALPREWFDSEIEVRGLSYPNFSDGTATGFRFHASDTNCVRVLSAGIADRFDGRPLMTIAEAAEHPKGWNSRIRIAGTFTGYRPDGPISWTTEPARWWWKCWVFYPYRPVGSIWAASHGPGCNRVTASK